MHNTNMAETPKYSIVEDQGGNIGLMCPQCGRAVWNDKYNPRRWDVDEDCSNCVLILSTNSLKTETIKYYDPQIEVVTTQVANEKTKLRTLQSKLAKSKKKDKVKDEQDVIDQETRTNEMDERLTKLQRAKEENKKRFNF